jgi:hypothetical protein
MRSLLNFIAQNFDLEILKDLLLVVLGSVATLVVQWVIKKISMDRLSKFAKRVVKFLEVAVGSNLLLRDIDDHNFAVKYIFERYSSSSPEDVVLIYDKVFKQYSILLDGSLILFPNCDPKSYTVGEIKFKQMLKCMLKGGEC